MKKDMVLYINYLIIFVTYRPIENLINVKLLQQLLIASSVTEQLVNNCNCLK